MIRAFDCKERKKNNGKQQTQEGIHCHSISTCGGISLNRHLCLDEYQPDGNKRISRLANPGGRLHDDFNGTNKDVYVENFTDPAKGGQEIFARVRLDEYMETGPDAGKNKDALDRDAAPVVAGASIKDVSTWKTHIPGDAEDKFHEYVEWTTGGSTKYMPTFNKNKDSLAADINGTFAGTDHDPTTDDDRYGDYVDYSKAENASKTANAIYDVDSNDVDETLLEGGATEDVNIDTIEETHEAKITQDAEVITMEQWKRIKAHSQENIGYMIRTAGHIGQSQYSHKRQQACCWMESK